MVQRSAFSIFPATQKLSTFPDLTVKLTPKGPMKTVQPLGGNSRYSIQINLMSLKAWVQFAFIFTGATEVPPSAMTYGVDAMPCSVQNFGAEYVVEQTQPVGGVFPDTGIDPLKWTQGLYYVTLVLSKNVVHIEVRAISDGSLIWSTGSTQFPDFTFTDPATFPSEIGVEAVGESEGAATTFITFDATIEVSSSAPLFGEMLGDAYMWTYDDGLNGVLQLQWANETGESSNLWTNVISQTPTDIVMELSLAQGSQSFSNPPLGGALQDTVLTLKAQP